MRQEIDPKEAGRAEAFALWTSSPMPMVTLVKTMDVSRLVKYSKRKGMSLNMLMCWCIGRAASHIPEFLCIAYGNKFYRYDQLAIGPVVTNSKGGINYCDIPYTDDLQQFASSYRNICAQASAQCQNLCLDDRMMVIGTSAMIQTELDCIVNQYAKDFNNPMVMWGKMRKGWWKTTLPVSFQFHHVQMDGGHGARFLHLLQQEILNL